MIRFENIVKRYRKNTVVNGLNLEIPKGKIVALIGPSGCGKSTTLKMVNRLVEPTYGHIYVNGEDISGLDVIRLRRRMGFVIQYVGLFPHMTIRENIEIIARAEKRPEAEVTRRTEELMEMVSLDSAMLDRYPAQLSGGQQQRVGVARAFALDPEIILMDEPFSALDPISRASLQDELANIQNQLRKTIMFVTHDMDEAIRVADEICIMQKGRVVQCDTPDNIMRNPANDFVVEFIGKKRIMATPEAVLVEDIMNDRVVTCSPYLQLNRCLDRMRYENVDTMFVVDKHSCRLLGVLPLERIRAERDHERPASDLMLTEYIHATPSSKITDVMPDMDKHRLSCVPVLSESGRLLGVVTRNSIFATLSHYYIEAQEVQNVVH